MDQAISALVNSDTGCMSLSHQEEHFGSQASMLDDIRMKINSATFDIRMKINLTFPSDLNSGSLVAIEVK